MNQEELILLTLTVLTLILIIFYFTRGAATAKTILLIGSRNSGKTCFLLKASKTTSKTTTLTTSAIATALPRTITSIKEWHTLLPTGSGSEMCRFVDLPGHSRLGWKLDSWTDKAHLILFFIDSSQDLKEAAEILFRLLENRVIVKKKVPIKIICNKSDLFGAKSTSQICSDLETELDKIRASKATDLLEQDADEQKEYLGFEGEAFSFDHVTNHVSFAKLSVAKDTIDTQLINDLTLF